MTESLISKPTEATTVPAKSTTPVKAPIPKSPAANRAPVARADPKPADSKTINSSEKLMAKGGAAGNGPEVSRSDMDSKGKQPWHVNPMDDVEPRRVVIQKIVRLLDGCKPKAFIGRVEKLIDLARKLEVALYKSSKSKEEYMNTSTLRARVVKLVKASNRSSSGVKGTATAKSDKGHAKPAPSSHKVNGKLNGSSNGVGVKRTIMVSEKQRQDVLRQRQQRLLLLRHASQCPSTGEEKCLVTPHCAAMKRLWKHIAKCKDAQCGVPHCVSSRFVLSHYHRCQDKKCPVCQPVRVISLRHRQQKQVKAAKAKAAQLQAKANGLKRNNTQKNPRPSSNGAAEASPSKKRRVGALVPKASATTDPKSALVHARAKRLLEIKAREQQIAAYRLKQAKSKRRAALTIDPRRARSCFSGTGPSLPLSLHRGSILSHLKSLKVESLQTALAPLLRKLMESKYNKGVFNEPVDPVALNIPDYLKVIKRPMDLGTVRQKLEDGKYAKLEEFVEDVKLTFNNAIAFNPPEHPVNVWSSLLLKTFESDLPKILQKIKKEVRRRNDKCQLCFQSSCEICPLCSRGCVAFEPKVIYCSGPCANRIGRNSNFYVSAGSSYSWCSDCYDRSKGDSLEAQGRVFKKADLEKKRNNELVAEPWVSCDKCDKWIHQVCALFNQRKNNPTSLAKYVCPQCLLEAEKVAVERAKAVALAKNSQSANEKPPNNVNDKSKDSLKRKASVPKPSVKTLLPYARHVPDANDLEQSRLGVFLESWVRDRYGSARVKEKNNPPKIFGELGPDPSKIHIRILSNYDVACKVKPFVKKAFPSYPDSFNYRSRCIFLFQELDGVDVLIYAMFVQEYGSECPDPNRRKLYIAYLDSVHYFRPRRLRTLVYQELILAYLEYSRRNGFTSAYIWACPPPNKRDDYILHCHPEHQRVPSADRLRKWYHDMIRRGCKQGIITGSCSLFDEHFEETLRPNPKGKNKKQKKKSKKGKKGSKQSVKIEKTTSESTGSLVVKKEQDSSETTANGNNKIDGSLPLVPSEGLNQSKEKKDTSRFISTGNGLRAGDNRMLPEDLERRKKSKLVLLGKLPYFEGDYWPQEAEELAKEQEAKKKKEEQKPGRNRRRQKKDGGSDNISVHTQTESRTAAEAAAAKNQVGGGDRSSGIASLKSEEKSGNAESSSTDIKRDVSHQLLVGRLSEQLEAMKGDFLVVKLAHECARCGQYLLRGRWECRHPECSSEPVYNKPCPFSLCNSCYILERARPVELQHAGGCIGSSNDAQPKPAEEEKKKDTGQDQEHIDVSAKTKEKKDGKTEEKKDDKKDVKKEETKDNKDVKKEEPKADKKIEDKKEEPKDDKKIDKNPALSVSKPTLENASLEKKDQKAVSSKEIKESDGLARSDEKRLKTLDGKSSARSASEIIAKRRMMLLEEQKKRQEAKKEQAKKVENWRKIQPVCSRETVQESKDHVLHYVDDGMLVKTPVYDKIHKNHLVESRHAFLALCTGNRYQFDQLRRAKHSTMMVLYHLHNPEAPAHLYTCNECQKDILSGSRYHCDLCSGGNFDLCEVCARRVQHPHKLTPFVVTRGVNSNSPDAQQLQQRKLENRRARKHSLQLFLQALVHASACGEVSCDNAPCKKMKDLLAHRLNCKVRVRGGCEVCRRVLCLVQMHARSCTKKQCKVPHCDDLKAHLAKQKVRSEALKARASAIARRKLELKKMDKLKSNGQSPKSKSTAASQIKTTVVAGSGGTKLKFRVSSAKEDNGKKGTTVGKK